MRGSPIRTLAIGLCLCLSASSCAGLARHSGAKKSQAPLVDYGKGQPKVIEPSYDFGTSTKKSTGDLRIRVLDDQSKPLPGAIIRYQGPQNGKSATNARGEMLVHLKPGRYKISIQRCGVDIIANSQQTGEAVVTAGTQTPWGVLSGISWARRFTTPDQGRASKPPPWHIGQTITVGIAVQDDCTYQLVANYAVPMFAWRLSSGFKLAKTPVYKTDASGFVNASVTCVAKPQGVESIMLYDRTETSNNADVTLTVSRPEAGHDFCE